MNKKLVIRIQIAIGLMFVSGISYARDLGVIPMAGFKGRLSSTLLYSAVKSPEDFDSRGSGDFKSHAVGVRFAYSVDDSLAIGLKGGTYVDPQMEIQGSQWESRAGYFYGIDLEEELFPTTEWRPGLLIAGGVLGFQVPLDRLLSGGAVTLIDQKMSGYEYHGSVLMEWKLGRFSPYGGLRGFGRTVYWRNNRPAAGEEARITGHSDGNVSLVLGCPVKLSSDIRMVVEGRVLNESVITVGFQYAAN